MDNNTSGINTLILIIILVLLVGGGVWWYQTYGPGAPVEQENGFEVNIGTNNQ